MSWINDIFGHSKSLIVEEFSKFGRFSDAYKLVEKYSSWDLALLKFREEDYLNSYELFFDYLIHNENIETSKTEETLKFSLLQGSKVITGRIEQGNVRAEAVIAKVNKFQLGYLRQLAERNYALEYSRYAITPDDEIALVFDSYVNDCSPYKLYFGLKEIALNADKLDDLLVDEFADSLIEVNTGHIRELPQELANDKLSYIRTILSSCKEYYDSNISDPKQNPGALSYVILSELYKLDYLVKPEGHLLEAIERTQRIYFKHGKDDMEMRNNQMYREVTSLMERSDPEMQKELYGVPATFGVTKSVSHFEVRGIIQRDWNNFQWYKKNELPRISIYIGDYIMGHILFNYAPPEPIRALCHMYFRVSNNDYFRHIGYDDLFYDSTQDSLNEKEIKQALKAIERHYKEDFPSLDLNLKELRFDNVLEFIESYLIMIEDLKL